MRGLHYGWVIMVVSMLTVLGALGFARFGYTMILPDMQAALGFVTLFFGLGQAAGPAVTGGLADATASFAPAFLLAAGVAFLGGIGSLLLRPPNYETGFVTE